jgi:hypothetical protein
MDKKIIWEYYNPKDAFEEMFVAQQLVNDDDEEWKDKPQAQMPPFVNNPFSPKDYWVANCNFRLTEKHQFKLNYQIDGVEAFKILSAYRFVVCIGIAFDWSKVRLEIEKSFCDKHISYTDDDSVNNQIQKTKTQLSKYQHWIMYVLPNGTIYTAQSDHLDSTYLHSVENVKLLSKEINGIVIESDTCKTKS